MCEMLRSGHPGRGLLIAAGVIAGVWAVWWTFFGIASGVSEKLTLAGVLLHTAVPGLLFLAPAVIIWFWPLAGGIIVLVEAAAVLILYPIAFRGQTLMIATTLPLLTALPIVAGVLALLAWRRSRRAART